MATTKVKLVNKSAKKEEDQIREFDIDHAQRLLKYQDEQHYSDWELAPNSGFKFENGTIEPTNKGANKESDKPGSNK